MPWVSLPPSVCARGALLDISSAPPPHAATKDRHDAFSDPARPLAQWPSSVLRPLLARLLPAELDALLFADLAALHSRGTLHRTARALLPAVRCSAGECTWNPCAVDVHAPGHALYSLLALRISVLERLRASFQVDAAAAADVSLALRYCTAYLDAHLLAACVIEDAAAAPPADDSPLEALLCREYGDMWRSGAAFGVHSLPNVSPALLPAAGEHGGCLFLGISEPPAAAAAPPHPVQEILAKCVPRRCELRAVAALAREAAARDEAVADWLCAVLAAALLGVYRHARIVPPLPVRLRVYRAFFHAPRGALAEHLANAARARGDCAAAAASPATPERRAALQSWNQDALGNALREYMCALLPLLDPALHAVLCAARNWRPWHASVAVCGDSRLRARLTCELRSGGGSYSVNNTLLPPRRPCFLRELNREFVRALDAGGASEAVCDALLRHEAVRALVALVDPRGSGVLSTSSRLPNTEAAADAVQQRGRVPLALLGGSPPVLRLYERVRQTYELHARTGGGGAAGRAHVVALVRMLQSASMYQFQLLHAYVQACLDRRNLFCVNLPPDLVASAPAAAFACTCCRRFCGRLAALDSVAHGNRGASLRSGHHAAAAATARTLVEYYGNEARSAARSDPYPPDPAAYDASPDVPPVPLPPAPEFHGALDSVAALPVRQHAQRGSAWVCGSKRSRVEGRKTRQTHVAVQRISDAITRREAANAERNGATKRRRDLRLYYEHSQCGRTPLFCVPDMRGVLLCLDDHAYAQCCQCASYVDMCDGAQWRGARFLCIRCTTPPPCRICKEPSCSRVFYALQQQQQHWTAVHVCEAHCADWLVNSPVYFTVDVIDQRLRAQRSRRPVPPPQPLPSTVRADPCAVVEFEDEY